MFQGAGQLESAAADESRPREHFDAHFGIDGMARGYGHLLLPIHQNLAGHDQGLRFLAGLRQAAVRQQPVEPELS